MLDAASLRKRLLKLNRILGNLNTTIEIYCLLVSMKILILAAGYGTRLTRDLAEYSEYAHLIGCPKPLLPVAGKPLITYWMEMLSVTHVHQSDVCIIVSEVGLGRCRYLALLIVVHVTDVELHLNLR